MLFSRDLAAVDSFSGRLVWCVWPQKQERVKGSCAFWQQWESNPCYRCNWERDVLTAALPCSCAEREIKHGMRCALKQIEMKKNERREQKKKIDWRQQCESNPHLEWRWNWRLCQSTTALLHAAPLFPFTSLVSVIREFPGITFKKRWWWLMRFKVSKHDGAMRHTAWRAPN